MFNNVVGTISDITISFETEINQPLRVNEEKINIYKITVEFYKINIKKKLKRQS